MDIEYTYDPFMCISPMGRITQESLFRFDLTDAMLYVHIDGYDPHPALVGAMIVIDLMTINNEVRLAIDDITYGMVSQGLMTGRIGDEILDTEKAMYYIAEGLHADEMEFELTPAGLEYVDQNEGEEHD